MKLNALSMDELLRKMRDIESDPANRNSPGSFYIYLPAARKNLDKIARAITDLLIAGQKANGTYVVPDGYGGRKSNRR